VRKAVQARLIEILSQFFPQAVLVHGLGGARLNRALEALQIDWPRQTAGRGWHQNQSSND
jgi:hypothetical protein